MQHDIQKKRVIYLNGFGKVVKKVLIDKSITQTSLAEKMSCSRSALASALNRDNVSIKQMQAIAAALDCDLKIELIPKKGS